MNRFISNILLSIGACCLLATAAGAQPGLYTEDAIQDQDKFLQAKNLVLLGKLDKAEELYLAFAKGNKRNDVVMYELSRLYMNKDDIENAEKYIRKAIQINPKNQWYHRLQANYAEKQELYEAAMLSYDKLIALDPQNVSYLNKHAQLATRALDNEKALSSYHKLEEILGVSEDISRKKFKIYSSSNDEQAAISELQKLVNTFPRSSRYRNNMASYLIEIGKDKEAMAQYQQVLRMDPEDPIALIAVSAVRTSDSADSGSALTSALSQVIANPDIVIDQKIGELLPMVSDMGQLEQVQQSEVIKLVRQLTEVHPNEAKSHAILGDALIASGDEPSAILAYQRAVELTKNVFPIWEQLMYAQENQKQYETLAVTAEEALDYYPNQPLCYYFLGIATARKIDPQLSKEDLFLRGISAEDHLRAQKLAYGDAIGHLDEALLMTGNNQPLQYQILRSMAFIAYDYEDIGQAESYALQALAVQGATKDSALDKLIQSIEQQNKN